MNRILIGDVREQLATLPDESVHCVVTSPPYWGLRDYGSPGQLGLEPTPEEYVANMVAVFRDVRRVLRSDGTLWLNLGDSYAGSGNGGGGSFAKDGIRTPMAGTDKNVRPAWKLGGSLIPANLKPKDLVGIPWRVAFALQADGWWLRSDIIWSKPNPMPESVTDRPTKAHEYLFLLSKSERYYYDNEAIKEPLSPVSIARISQPNFANQTGGPKDYALTGEGIHSQRKTLENFAKANKNEALGKRQYDGFNARWEDAEAKGETPNGRNKRTVWEIATQPYAEAHFATYPEALVKPCILAGCPEGGVVLDPFFGSGTTGVVAKRAGRSYIGIELNPTYAALALKRIGTQEVLL